MDRRVRYESRSNLRLGEPDRLTDDHEALWRDFLPELTSRLDEGDDPIFWKTAVTTLLLEEHRLHVERWKRRSIAVCIGKCSHWVRPNQTQYTLGGGFAAPEGYGDGNGFLGSFPKPDWSLTWVMKKGSDRWEFIESDRISRALVFRLIFPNWTAKHVKASVYSVWEPGTPTTPGLRQVQLFFFRRYQAGWRRAAELIEYPVSSFLLDGKVL